MFHISIEKLTPSLAKAAPTGRFKKDVQNHAKSVVALKQVVSKKKKGGGGGFLDMLSALRWCTMHLLLHSSNFSLVKNLLDFLFERWHYSSLKGDDGLW